MSSEPGKPWWQYLLEGMAYNQEAAARRTAIEKGLPSEWYTVPQAAAILKQHPKTVYERVRRREIRASKPSPRKTRIHKTDLVNYLLRQEP